MQIKAADLQALELGYWHMNGKNANRRGKVFRNRLTGSLRIWAAAILLLWGWMETDTAVQAAGKSLSQFGAGVGTILEQTEGQRETSGEQQSEEAEEADASLVMANVQNVLNVREEPDEEAEKVGYLYADCGGEILERKDGWTRLQSGSLTGWAKDEYLLFGEEAEELAEKTGRTQVRVLTGGLRVRREPDIDAKVIDLTAEGSVYDVVSAEELEFSDGIQISDEWIAVDFEGETGFLSAAYTETSFVVAPGESLEEIAEREAAQKQAEEERKAAEKEAGEKKAQSRKEQNGKQQEQTGTQEKKKDGTIPADVSDLTLLAALIHSEAGNQSYEGQLAVGAVVMNRVRSSAYPNTIRDVILASGQFTPVASGQVAERIATGNIKASSIQAAQEAIAGVSNVGTATHFRRAGSREGIVIGNHVFW